MERRIRLLTKWFERLRKETLEQIKNDGVAVSDLCDKLSSLNALVDKSIKTFLKDKMKLLSDSDTHELVFRYLNMYWSYLSYHLLEKLIRDYEMDDLEKKMEEFKAEVMEFMEQTPVKVYAAAQISQDVESPDSFVKFVSYHKYPKDSLLKCVKDIRRKFSTEYKFEEYALMLSAALPQSIEIVWFIPESVVQHVIQVTSTTEKAIFRKLMLIKLECNGETIYEDDLTSEVKLEAVPPSRVRNNMYSLSPRPRRGKGKVRGSPSLPSHGLGTRLVHVIVHSVLEYIENVIMEGPRMHVALRSFQ